MNTRLLSICTRSSLAVIVAFGALSMAACAAAPAATVSAPNGPAEPAASPAHQSVADERDEDMLETVDEVTSAFEQAEQALAASFDGAGEQERGDDAFDQPGARPAQPAPMGVGGADRCTRACDALGSMRRSAARLCDLTGEDDPRCDSVAGRVSAAVERVRAACPACQLAGP